VKKITIFGLIFAIAAFVVFQADDQLRASGVTKEVDAEYSLTELMAQDDDLDARVPAEFVVKVASASHVESEQHMLPIDKDAMARILGNEVRWSEFQQVFYNSNKSARLAYARVAAGKGNLELIRLMLDAGRYSEIELLKIANSAVLMLQYEVVEALFAYGAPVNQIAGTYGMLDALFMSASHFDTRHQDLLRLITSKGGVIDEVNLASWTAKSDASRDALLRKLNFSASVGIMVFTNEKRVITF